jgi:hypothetical protein
MENPPQNARPENSYSKTLIIEKHKKLKGRFMKSLVIMSYKQPYKSESNIRWGIVEKSRDTYRYPIKKNSYYRWFDSFKGKFIRSRTLLTINEFRVGYRSFYAERTNWKITIPFLGSIFSPLFSSKT